MICPTGSRCDFVSSPFAKNKSLPELVEAVIERTSPAPDEGRFAIVTNAGRDAVDADGAFDEQH